MSTLKPMSTLKRNFKDAIYGQLARIGKGVSSPKRLELLDLLCQTERSVEALAREASLSVANTSRHLQILRAARLVEADKRGLHVIYRLADPAVGQYFLAMRKLAEARLVEIEQITHNFFDEKEGFDAVNQKTLFRRIREGSVTVLDVRPSEEYLSGHLPHALSIPLAELKRRLAELPRDREVVAYCRGPYCVFSAEAVDLLRAEGFKAIRFEEGVLDWQAHEQPLAADALSLNIRIANSIKEDLRTGRSEWQITASKGFPPDCIHAGESLDVQGGIHMPFITMSGQALNDGIAGSGSSLAAAAVRSTAPTRL